jgi:4-amino-4-deoxy-L-arabinose transferase-like glycosyltransferase
MSTPLTTTPVIYAPKQQDAPLQFPARSRLSRLIDALNRNSLRVLLGISALYLAITITQASIRLLWFDEFITFYTAKLNSVRAIWHALANGIDPNPPLTHILVMWSMRIFGDSSLAVRLPAILASGLGLVCLYLFLKKRLPVTYAAVGTLFFMATAAFEYSYESRSYALTLGFAMLSLLSWRWTIEGRHPNRAAAVMAIALELGISSNYFAVLAFFPIAAGEFVRTLERRRIDYRVCLALAIGAVPLYFYLPLINHAIATFSPHAWNKVRFRAIDDSYEQMLEAIFLPALVTICAGLGIYLYERKRRFMPPVLPRHEAVAVFFQMLYPVIAYFIALVRGGMLSPRFVLPLCYGFAIAAAVILYKLFARSAAATALVLLILLGWVVTREAVFASDWINQRTALFRVRDRIPPWADTVVVSDSLLVLPLNYYSPRLRGRIIFPVDFTAIREYKGEDSPEQNLWSGRNVFPVPIVPLHSLQNVQDEYFIATTPNNWLLQKLRADGIAVHKVPIYPGSQDIRGFTPLCHGEVFYYQVGRGRSVPGLQLTVEDHAR